MTATLLLIDDSDTERALTRKLLEAEGYTVIEASGGEEGLTLFRQKRPDLVLCDLMMPGRSGFDTVRALREVNPEARIVAVSGTLFGVADHETMEKRLGLAGVVEKPFRKGKLLDVIDRALRLKR